MPANPSNQKPAGDDRNLVAVDEKYPALTFEDKLHRFWKNYQTPVIGGCTLVLLGLLAKGGWEHFAAQRELDVEKAYASASTPEQLRSFMTVHPTHQLTAIAQLRIADEAYVAGKSTDALVGYEKAGGIIKDGPLGARALLGRAMAKVQAGKTAEGIGDLKQMANDTKQFKAVRTEAIYQLESLAADAGNSADVQKYSDQLMQVDPSSSWAQRGMMLRASVPAATSAKDEVIPSLQVKLPGK